MMVIRPIFQTACKVVCKISELLGMLAMDNRMTHALSSVVSSFLTAGTVAT